MKRMLLFLSLALLLAGCAPRAGERVVIRLAEGEFEATSLAVDHFVEAAVPFAMERTLRPDDSPEMKALLARILWKNNELLERVDLPASVRIVDVRPGEEEAVIACALKEGWDVRTPSAWRKLIQEENRADGFRCFYVASDGDDAADGRTPGSAWRSLERVNEAELGFGDTVLFRSGDVFRGSLVPLSGRPGAPILYGRYGTGEKPVIEPSYDASDPADWTPAGDGLWKCVRASHDELSGVIFNHGADGCAFKVDRPEQLGGRDLHFCWLRDEGAVYLVSGVNPALRFRSIELGEKRHVINEDGCHDVCYEGLWLRYGGAHGIGGSDVRNIVVKDCDICWIGGSTLYVDDGGRGVRYGNGIEFWSAAEHIVVEGCRIWECWDAGLTNQSNEPGVVQKDIVYRGNEIWNCEYSYEYWQQGDGARTEDISFINNVCRDAGKGWGHRQRWNPNAAHLMFYDTTAETARFVVKGNYFGASENCGMRLFNAWYASLTMEDNTWETGGAPLCRYHGRPTSDLIYKYPDRLDRIHDDNLAEIEGQTVEQPEVFGPGPAGLERFRTRFGFD
ncbi:MAG: right-handed parallel beta-helix repeat-containing protein [Bacteroidales bacterium]|nr:right-handed parallel beta-helix repeat-containing protein [Bacteroidales bacterium]